MQLASISRYVGDPKDKYLSDQDEHPPLLPERLLVLAVLERACRDLSQESEPDARKSAIRWFRAYMTKEELEVDCRYTFEQVVSIMGFGIVELNFILSKVIHAEKEEAKRVQILRLKALN